MEYRKLTKYAGTYQRVSDVKTYKGKPDIVFDISYKHEGKKIWEKIGWLSEGYSAKLAFDVRSERLRSMRHGEELPRQRKKHIYFKELADKYLKWAKANKKSSATDGFRYSTHLAPRFDNKRLNEISSFDLEKMKSELSRKGLAPASVKHVLVLFRGMMNKAIFWKLFNGANPVKGVKMPVVQNQCDRFLTYQEAHSLLNELMKRSPKAHDLALLALHTGMRRSEIFNLKWQDLDFQHDVISIFDAKSGNRKATMTDAVKEMLLSRKPESPSDYIFQDRNGGKYTETPDVFQEVADKLFNVGIRDRRKRIVFHSLRHTFASWLILQGESLLTVKEALGHKSLQMVQRYSHLVPGTTRRATLQLEQAFNGERNRSMDKVGVMEVQG
jgi:integrase